MIAGMKLYTKRGDEGETDLFGGKRIAKDSLRIEAFGTVDELNSAVGVASRRLQGGGALPRSCALIQERLFELGADLATPRKAADDQTSAGGVPRISVDQISEAERMIDQVFAPLPPMRNFILPGGCELAARLHVARTVLPPGRAPLFRPGPPGAGGGAGDDLLEPLERFAVRPGPPRQSA